MTVTDLMPAPAERPIAEVLDRLDAAPRQMPFAPAILDLLADLSRRILTSPATARRPDAVALAYWLRPAHLKTLAERYPPPRDGGLRVPAGLAFQIPPVNVDTMFAYSWAVGLLAGNRQIVRLSRRRGELAGLLLPLIGEALAAAPDLADGSAFVEYERDEAVTAAISAQCDLRVIWGGDATVAAIRAVPLSPHAKETVFADRLSLTALDAAAVQGLDPAALDAFAGKLFADVLTFDQMACSSPRQLIWVGDEAAADRADEKLMHAMSAEIARRGHEIPTAVALDKYTTACRTALRQPVRAIRLIDTGWVLVDLGGGIGPAPPGPHPGGGLLYRRRVDDLAEIAPMIGRPVQTLTHFGFDRTALDGLAIHLAGKGIDRMVPVGEALAFDLVWDGNDLIDAFTRRVTVKA